MSSTRDSAGHWVYLFCCVLLVAGLHGHARASASQFDADSPPRTRARFAPPPGNTLLIIGQDLQSVADYVAGCRSCPAPAGVTTYLDFYELLSGASAQAFGGLGENAAGQATAAGDWGAGKSSAARSARDYPSSALVLGLNISENLHPHGLVEIVGGQHDAQIRRLAEFCRAVRKPVFLRIGYEFNGPWNQGYADRAQYIGGWRHIVDVLRAAKADNIAFVWQASASPIGDLIEGGRHEDIRNWYPGASYVDWMALSWFLPPYAAPAGARLRVPTQLQLAQEVLAFARASGKPVMIAESTPQGYDLGRLTRANISPLWDGPAGGVITSKTANEIWAEWYAPLFTFIETNRDVIGAFAYIDAHWDAQPMWGPPYKEGYWGDSRIQANPTIQRRWVAEVTRPVWLHGGAALFDILNADPAAAP